jgi:hypothetical protein
MKTKKWSIHIVNRLIGQILPIHQLLEALKLEFKAMEIFMLFYK